MWRRVRRFRFCIATFVCTLSVVILGGGMRAVGKPARMLTEDDFRQIGAQGFGDAANSYAWSMAWFKDKLYIGTNHNFACLTRSIRDIGEVNVNPEVPQNCEPNLPDMDFRGRIYAYDPVTNTNELVYISPEINVLVSDGSRTNVALDLGYRTMVVFHESDGVEALYIGSFVSTELPGKPPRLLRTTDGLYFAEVPGVVSNNPTYTSYRSLTVFKGKMYVIAIGQALAQTALLEASDPASGDFRVVSPPYFGDAANTGVFELAVFKGYLYVGTATSSEGYQLLKTQAAGPPPYAFQKVLVKGAYRGPANQNVVSIYPYKDFLYVGSGINFVALDYFPDVPKAPAELVRVRADDTWDLVCGDARNTPDGRKDPISGMEAGCDNFFTGYIWRMVEHDGVLYMGTFDLSVFTQYFQGVTIEQLDNSGIFDRYPSLRPLVVGRSPDEIGDIIAAVQGGFDLWSTTDGKNWTKVSHTGFGDSFSYGVRSFESTPMGLFLGTANPFFGFRLFLGQPPGTDTDGDGRSDAEDNCPLTWNLNQLDSDGDGIGDACDDKNVIDGKDGTPDNSGSGGSTDDTEPDVDGDGIPNALDNCPTVANPDQLVSDGNGAVDACDTVPQGPTDTENPGSGLPTDGGETTAPRMCGAGASILLIAAPLMFLGSGMRKTRRR